MNERINELADQASLYAVSDNSSMLFDVWKQRYTEKLSELIVRECAEILDEKIYPTSHPFNALGPKLKEHFGVKE